MRKWYSCGAGGGVPQPCRSPRQNSSDNRNRSGNRPEYGRQTGMFESRNIAFGNDATAEDDDVIGTSRSQQPHDLGKQREVGSRKR